MSIILQKGSFGEEVVLLQRALNEFGGYNLLGDGDFGNGTANSLKDWQKNNSFIVDGIYNSDIHQAISNLIDFKYIRLASVGEYAKSIGVEPAILQAFTIVESKGAGFFNDGSCKILYERHIFYNQVVRKFGKKTADSWMTKFPNICHPVWNQSSYLGGIREWDRLSAAKDLDPECALLATSWGMFQIMGFNYSSCGYANVGDYVSDMRDSERFHIGAVTMFIRNNRNLYRACLDKDFNEIARLYNGPGYEANKYHIKLRDNYKSLIK